MHTRQFKLSTVALLLALAAAPHGVRAQSYNAICTLPDGTLLQVGDKDDVPIMSAYDTSWLVQANPAGTPAKGEFTAVCADAAGNLFVAFEDAGNPKKKVEGFLRRVGGTWSTMPPLPKGWSGVYDPVAAAPDKLWFRSWHSEDRRTIVAHWNGTAYTMLPLPGTKTELHTLFLDTDGALLTDGDIGDKAGVYRFNDGSWQPLGNAMDVLKVERIVRLSDGNLVCSAGKYSDDTHALFQWRGASWSPLPGADVAPKRAVEDLCAGPDGRLYLLIEADEEEGDPQRLACWKNGTLNWYQGSQDKAVLRNSSGTINLYQLACDRTGLLHANYYGGQRTFPVGEFEWAIDGYPATDARAAEVWAQYQVQHTAYAPKANAVNEAYGVLAKARTAANALEVQGRYNDWYNWYSKETGAFLDLVPKGANRLVDRYREQLASANLMYAAIRDHASAVGREAGGSSEQQLYDQVLATSSANKPIAQALEAELLTYPLRNGLAPMKVSEASASVPRDTYPAKDVEAAAVLGVLQANRSAYNRHVATCRTFVAGVGNMSGAAGFHLQQYAQDSLLTWVASVNKQLDALAVPPGQNRLQDGFRGLLDAVSRMAYSLDGYGGLLTSNSTVEEIRDQSDRLEKAQADISSSITNLNTVYSAYLVRNGLTDTRP